MGKVLRTQAARHRVAVTATDLPDGAVVHVVTGVCDLQGLTPSVRRRKYPASEFARGPVGVMLDRDVGSYLRVEVHDGDGRLIGFGNPFWMLPGPSTSQPRGRCGADPPRPRARPGADPPTRSSRSPEQRRSWAVSPQSGSSLRRWWRRWSCQRPAMHRYLGARPIREKPFRARTR